MNQMFDIESGNQKVKELDALEAKRVAEIRNTTNKELDISAFKNVFYVSEKNGSDTYIGRTPENPFKTIMRASFFANAGDLILLERGSVWREKLNLRAGITITAYGEGKKPIISGSPEDGADPEKWELVHENKENGAKIWKYANERMNDVGSIFFDRDENYMYKGYAMKYAPFYKSGKYTRCDNPEIEYDPFTMLENLHFFHKADSVADGEYINVSTSTGPIYLRCDAGNPGEIYKNIEFNTRGNNICVQNGNVLIDNLCIVHSGSHGIGTGTMYGLTVTNCEIGWIGGSLQSYQHNETGSIIRFGNGVEIYGSCKDYTIENCYIHNCYDAGVTHQYSMYGNENCIMEDVVYKNNVLTDSVYNIEYFNSEYANYIRTGNNILFEGNLLRRAGYGFGSTRHNGHHQGNIRSGGQSNPFKNFVIKDNILDRSVEYLIQCETQAKEYIPTLDGNTYIQGVGNRLCHFGAPPEWRAVDENVYSHINDFLGDKNAKVYFVEKIPYYEFKEYCGEK